MVIIPSHHPGELPLWLHFSVIHVFCRGGNVGDLLIHFLSITPNFHGARRTDQLVIHHMVSIICIPAFVILEVPQDTLTRFCSSSPVPPPPCGPLILFLRFQLLLEMSGGLSSLVVALSLTPAINSVLHFWFLCTSQPTRPFCPQLLHLPRSDLLLLLRLTWCISMVQCFSCLSSVLGMVSCWN